MTVADVAVIIGYILGVSAVGTWVRQISMSLILSRAALKKTGVNHFPNITRNSKAAVCRCSSKKVFLKVLQYS